MINIKQNISKTIQKKIKNFLKFFIKKCFSAADDEDFVTKNIPYVTIVYKNL